MWRLSVTEGDETTMVLWSEVAVNTAVNNTYLSNSRTFLPTCIKSMASGEGWRYRIDV